MLTGVRSTLRNILFTVIPKKACPFTVTVTTEKETEKDKLGLCCGCQKDKLDN